MTDRFSVCQFSDDVQPTFLPEEYSYLKFGHDMVIRRLGYELADKLWAERSVQLLAQSIVVLPSSYNYVPIAATILTGHFADRLNQHLIMAGADAVEISQVHRRATYVPDYGVLTKEERETRHEDHRLYFNHEVIRGDKLLIVVDDVYITGHHERRLQTGIEDRGINNHVIYVYLGEYQGPDAQIEGRLNSSAIRTVRDYVEMAKSNYTHMLVRPAKFLLRADRSELMWAINQLGPEFAYRLYNACIGENYHLQPEFEDNAAIVRRMIA